MKIFMYIDLEGATGIVSIKHQANPDAQGYQEARRFLMSDVNSAISGAVEAGADEILLYDMHHYGLNVILEDLHPKASVIMGKPQGLFLDRTFAGVLFIGFHSMAGTEGGMLTHTYTSGIESINLNGRPAGEIEMEAALAGEVGVPVIMVSGDSRAIEQAEESLGNIEFAVVKYAASEDGALCLPPAVTSKLISKRAKKAVKRRGKIKPFVIEPPVELRIKYYDPKKVPNLPEKGGKEGIEIKKTDSKTLLIKCKSLRTVWQRYKRDLLVE